MAIYTLIERGPFSTCRYVLNSHEMAAGRARIGLVCGEPTVDGVACTKHLGTTWKNNTDPDAPTYGSREERG